MAQTLRLLVQAFGLALCLSGGLWSLQGFGLIHWPANSFMLGETQWALRGMIAFAVGAFLLWLGFRRV